LWHFYETAKKLLFFYRRNFRKTFFLEKFFSLFLFFMRSFCQSKKQLAQKNKKLLSMKVYEYTKNEKFLKELNFSNLINCGKNCTKYLILFSGRTPIFQNLFLQGYDQLQF
jgi:hypothetical protein